MFPTNNKRCYNTHVKAESTVGVLQQSVGTEDRVVGLDDSGGDLWRRRHGETKLGLASVVHTEALQKEGSQTRSSSSSGGMKD